MTNSNLTSSEISCGYVDIKTGKSGVFPSQKELDNYNKLPWYEKLFAKNPQTATTQQNLYLEPEFYKRFTYTQNCIESSWFSPSRQFQIKDIADVYIERNKYSVANHKYFYIEDGNRIYLDSLALSKGIFADLIK